MEPITIVTFNKIPFWQAQQDCCVANADHPFFVCGQLTYTGTGKNRFQIEVPEACMDRVPHAWEATGQRKGFRRFRPPAITELFARLVIAEDAKQESMQGIMRRLFASFSSRYYYQHCCTEPSFCITLI